MKKVQFSLFVVLVLLAVLTAACGGSSTPAATSPTTAPTAQATATPESSALPAQPTSVPVPTLGPGRFTDALNKMTTANAYQFEIERTGTGIFSPLNGAGTPEAGTPTPTGASVPDISIKGSVNGKSTDLTLGGLMANLGGGSSPQGIEMITVGDKSYLKGPIPAMGATEDKWYEMPAGMASSVMPAVDPATLFGSLTQTGVDPNAFAKTGSENLDNQSCDIYSGDKAVTVKAFQDLFKSSPNSNFVIDSADSRFWLCGDGYIHRTLLSLDAHQSDKPDQKGNFSLTLHVHDFGNVPAIQTPASSTPLVIPGMNPSGSETPGALPPAAGGTPTP